MGLLDGKVAIITGSGGGIGRCHALLFAKEGAKVVVNDLGGTRDGSGQSTKMADTVVDEIKKAGGQAVANYDSVSSIEGAKNVVKTALDAFGRADILVNNAGILRDKTLLKMSEQEWDLVIAVHLKGTYACTQAFAAHVKERAEKGDAGGRIVNTSSYAGLMGNFGQSNYAAAKAGIYGLTKVWALELAKAGVNVNCIAPMAKTRMTEDIAQVPDDMKPEQISPMVLFLCSDLAKDVNGKIFGIHGQQLLEYKMVMTPGVTKAGSAFWTPAEIKEALPRIGAEPAPAGGAAPAAAAAPAAMTPAQIIDKAFELMPQVFVADKAKGWTATIQFEISGANPWTVMIADGKCTAKKGLEGTPTCKVKTDAQTYSDILTGKERPEKAFMGGKITATNLGDMMKFGGAFDMKKAKDLAMAGQASAPATAPAAAAAAPATPSAIIEAAFKRMPEIFVPDKAKGWNANIHFEIKGAEDYTVGIKDGKCTTEKGKVGTPTCVVKTDAQTYADIVVGKERADKAFMGGKITATNLGDMMKFGGAFDMKKAAEMAKAQAPAPAGAAAPAAAAPGSPSEAIARAMNALPQAFKPEKATNWSAVVQFEIKGGEDWTVTIKDGKCSVAKGKTGTPTCVVKTDVDTYAKVSQGEMKAEQAFMQQKISATNLGDMMKFGGAFDMKKAAEIVKSGGSAAPAAAAPAAAAAPKKAGLNRDYIGQWYSGGFEWIKPEQTKAYALATNDKNPIYLEGQMAPPLFAVKPSKEVMFKAMTDPGLGADLLRLVHGEQDMEFIRPLRPGDLATMRATITGMEEKSSGELLKMQVRIYVDGQLAVRANESMFIRGEKKAEGGAKKEEPKDESAGRTIAYKAVFDVSKDQSLRYADASGDNNPIHVDDNVAKMAGHSGVILQGLCTMAFSQNAIVNEVLKGDATRLKRLAVRFAKPVYMNDKLTVEGWEVESRGSTKIYGFHVKNQNGVAVIVNGVAEVQS